MASQTALPRTGAWDTYYEETDPERRRAILSEAGASEAENNLNDLRERLWNLRYRDPGSPGRRVDLLLWQFVNLLCIYRTSGPGFLRKSGEKEIRGAMRGMGFEEAAALGDEGGEELYREFRNAARRYFSACEGDKAYRKKYFGIVTMNGGEYGEKLARDAWRLSEGVEGRFHLEKELGVLSRAVKDEFFAFAPDAQELWDRCAAAYRKQ